MVRKDKTPRRRQVGGTTQTHSRRKLYEVRWLDAYEKESGWHSLNDALKIRPPEVLSVGYVLAETEEYLILAADIGSDKMDNDVGQGSSDPWSVVIEQKEIT
ncbi:MAG: hypothetical protein CM15mV49_320 [uncultured marine virus]|nr:MAG: hypothetical protein CM15mV49_320 [uncultured marine virus]